MMNWEQFIECGKNTLSNLASSVVFKLWSAITVIMANELLGLHLQLFTFFVILIVIDLFTKWVALGHKYLVDGGAQDVCLIASIGAIRKARSVGLIKSSEMKHRFLGKILIYMIVIVIAGVVDSMLVLLKRDILFVEFAVWYLAVTELISTVENLNDAGVEVALRLIQMIKAKTGI